MKRFKPAPFRPAFGVAAAAMSAVTLAAAVALPIGLAGACAEDATLASRTPAVIELARIDVVAQPVRTVVLEPVHVVGRREVVRS
jgi:hypothetical protein